jgi:hypothetical protein
MSDATTSRAPVREAVPLRNPSAGEESQSAWASEETVPLRVAAERIEAEERADRLALVTGHRRALRR